MPEGPWKIIPPKEGSEREKLIIKYDDLPVYASKRLADLHNEVYKALIEVLEKDPDPSPWIIESAQRALRKRIVETGRTELEYLLGDTSRTGVMSALKYLDAEALNWLDRLRKTGEIPPLAIL